MHTHCGATATTGIIIKMAAPKSANVKSETVKKNWYGKISPLGHWIVEVASDEFIPRWYVQKMLYETCFDSHGEQLARCPADEKIWNVC